MKVVYIAHPISGDQKKNVRKVIDIIKLINLTEPDVVPFAPYIADCMAMDDSIPAERQRGIRNDSELFDRGFIDEVRLYGPTISEGMRNEIAIAKQKGIAVRPYTVATVKEYSGLYPND